MLRLLAAHKPSRLIFAVLTLSVALTGVVTNYSLSHNAMRAFESQLALRNQSQFLVSGVLSDVAEASHRKFDAGSFRSGMRAIFETILPVQVDIHPVVTRASQIATSSGQRPLKIVQVDRAFLQHLDVQPPPDAGWDHRKGICALGRGLITRLPEIESGVLALDGRKCTVVTIFEVPDTPPFIGLDDTVFVPSGIREMATDIDLGWSVFLTGPVGALEESNLRGALGAVLDLEYLNIWSGAAIVERAERLIRIVRLVSNSLGFVILMVGSASIASLMSFSVAERAKEIAVKRTIGASKAQIIAEIMSESLIIGALSALVGVFAGYYLALYLQAPLGEFLTVGLQEGETLSLWPLAKSIAVFLGICAVSGAVPGWHAASRDPATVLRAP